MSDFTLEPLILKLAEEFKRRGMDTHVALLRRYYRGYKARQKAACLAGKDPVWTEDMVIGWIAMMGIAPLEHVFPELPPHAPCPQCKGPASSRFTAATWRGGSASGCIACGARWVTRAGEL